MSCRRYLIYRRHLLPASESFIPEQALSVPGWRPTFLGFSRTPEWQDGALPTAQRLTRSSGLARLRVAAFARKGVLRGPSVSSFALLHAHFGVDGTQCLAFAARHHLPLIVTFHGYDMTIRDDVFAQSRAGRWYLQRRETLLRDADALIAISDFIKGRLVNAGASPQKVVRHYIGVDVPRASPGIDGRDGLLFVGRLVAKKGVDTLIEALRYWPERLGPVPPLTVLGDGPERSSLMRKSQHLRCDVRFLGAGDHKAALGAMGKARILCVPSTTAPDGDEEGLGLVGLEAQARHVPVAGSASGGIPEYVVDDVTGLLMTPDDPREWGVRLAHAYRDRDRLCRLAEAAYRQVNEKFNRQTQSRRLAEIYAQTTEGGPSE